MDRKNSEGQILAEVALVMAFIAVFLFAAISQMSEFKSVHKENQFGQKSYKKNVRRR